MQLTTRPVRRRLPYDALAFTVVAAAIAAGCGSSARPITSTSRDSAGITIVESTDPIWGPGDAWSLSPEPTVTIGMIEGPDEYILDRVTSGFRLEDGTVVIADIRALELRFYDGTGTHILTRGGEGAGPGEFRSMGLLWSTGDSLFLFDYGLGRVSAFSTHGEFSRVFSVDPATDGAFTMPSLSWSRWPISMSGSGWRASSSTSPTVSG